ncbi:uncharacterized protein LOC113456053 [Microtus ochrogaster]|uniref:Uncharacterized protein LOC113456053 n=1 Tax=Microtus ochrogaster TaxID=79684 RepID=A0ABM1TYE0_MICOH|nr:uncharacterized protein LOC113456053 [Microtus ochrogaster]
MTYRGSTHQKAPRFRRLLLCLASIPEGHHRPAASQPRIPGQQAGSEWAVPGRASPEAALSGLGRRASRRRDAHTRRAGSATSTVGTALPKRVRPYVSRRARDAPVPDRLEATGMSAPAAQPLGTSPVPTRPGVARPVPGSPPASGAPLSVESRVREPVAASRLDYRCGDTVWSPARAPRKRAHGRTAALHQERREEPATETQKGDSGWWLRLWHAQGPGVTANPPLLPHTSTSAGATSDVNFQGVTCDYARQRS